MALLKGEGTHQILYGAADIFSGLRHNRGYLSRPDHAGSFSGVLLIHGRSGLSSSVKSVARKLARNGLAVVVPDLYRGARQLRQPLPPWPGDGRVLADIGDAVTWMLSEDTPWISVADIGIVALDAGCAPAQRFAAASELIDRLVLVSPTAAHPDDGAPVPTLAFFGKEDSVVPAETRSSIRQAVDYAEWVLYGGAGHGLIDEAADEYRWEVAEDMLERIVGFLQRPQGE